MPELANRDVFHLSRVNVNSYYRTEKKYTPRIDYRGFFEIIYRGRLRVKLYLRIQLDAKIYKAQNDVYRQVCDVKINVKNWIKNFIFQ